MREAFYESINAAIGSYPSSTQHHDQRGSRKAAQLLTLATQNDYGSARTFSTNIVSMQIMLLMAIEAQNRGPASFYEGFHSSVWIGSAVGLAYSMKLHQHKLPDKALETEADSDDKLGRRLWWALIIMDRWHASSMSRPVLIPDSSVVVLPEDQGLLGEHSYHLTRKRYLYLDTTFTILTIDIRPITHSRARFCCYACSDRSTST